MKKPKATGGDRISRDEMFSQILAVIGKRSTCPRGGFVSSLIEKNHRIVSIGYCGAPSGLKHCLELGCEIGQEGGCQKTVHAESNAIAFAAKSGVSLESTTLWTSLSPCKTCAKLIINTGVTEVVYLETYRDPSGLELLKLAGVKVRKYKSKYYKHIKELL